MSCVDALGSYPTSASASQTRRQLCYTAIMPRRRKSRRPILERFMPIRASDFCNENLGDYFCDYPPPFAWPFMQKLRASRARVWFEHKTSGLLHKFGIQWTRCNFGGRRPWFICQCGKRVAKLYDTGSIVACRHCLDTIYESQRRGENGRKYLRACRIRLSIGGAPKISRDFPERPWRMHRKNYERIRIKAKKLEEPLRTNPHFRAREPDYTCHCFQ